ncbi:hypothetical protein AB1Y20_003115 [Prymnesium parvum]|uniref:Pre-mRNA-splicing factor SLU7 n=1 Tax=Prymnesium parvum TaxID=97485 RepID=A0AB34JBL4_PRYPA
MEDLRSLRQRNPEHKVPERDQYGFEVRPSNMVARKRMDALDNVSIPAHWTHPALHKTRSALQAARHSALTPDMSYDIDGDGFVSQRDYHHARKWDSERIGKLTSQQRELALKEEYSSLSAKLTDSEIGGNTRARVIMNALKEAPEVNDTWRHYNLREASLVINSLKHKSSQQATDCMSSPNVPVNSGPGGRALTRAQMLANRREEYVNEAKATADRIAKDIM